MKTPIAIRMLFSSTAATTKWCYNRSSAKMSPQSKCQSIFEHFMCHQWPQSNVWYLTSWTEKAVCQIYGPFHRRIHQWWDLCWQDSPIGSSCSCQLPSANPVYRKQWCIKHLKHLTHKHKISHLYTKAPGKTDQLQKKIKIIWISCWKKTLVKR